MRLTPWESRGGSSSIVLRAQPAAVVAPQRCAASPPAPARLCGGRAPASSPGRAPAAAAARAAAPLATRPSKDHRRQHQRLCPERSLPEAWERDFELNPEEPFLGGGAFAKISRVVDRSSNQAFALKVMSRPNFAVRGIEAQVDAEIEAMRRCTEAGSCRHVLRFCDVTEERDHVYIRMELCICDLLRFATCQPTGRLTETDGRHWAGQLLAGLWDLHQLGILHRDIKPENLLCTGDGMLKIGDFGWCAELSSAPCSLAGTLQYMAPEVLAGKDVQTEAVDVWSAGVTVLQLLTGRQLLTTYLGPGATGMSVTGPHQATRVKTMRLLTEIHERCPLPEDGLPSYLSPMSWDFLRIMAVPEVVDRATVPEALGHPWLSEEVHSEDPDVEEDTGPISTLEPSLSSSTNSASMPVLNVPTPPLAGAAGRRPVREATKSQPPPTLRATLGRRSEAQLHRQPSPEGDLRRQSSKEGPIQRQAPAPRESALPRGAPGAGPAPRLGSPAQAAGRSGEPRALMASAGSRASIASGPRFGSPSQQARGRTVAITQPAAMGQANLTGEDSRGESGCNGSRQKIEPKSPTMDSGRSSNRSLRRSSYPTAKVHEITEEEQTDVRCTSAGTGASSTAATANVARPLRNRRLTLPASPPPKSRGVGSLSSLASKTGPSTLRVYPGDALSRTSPPDCSKTVPPRGGLPAGRSENEPGDANADPLAATVREGKAADVVPRRTVVVCQWPTVAAINPAVQRVATVPQRSHPAPMPSPQAERCQLSPRQRTSLPGSSVRVPLTSPGAAATCAASALQQGAMPSTPGPSPERCRDIQPIRSQRAATFMTMAC